MSINSGSQKCKLYIGNTKIKKAYLGDTKIYSSGNIVTYCVYNGTAYQEEVEEGASCLSPKTFTPTLSGWSFVGWRQDTAASGSVLGSLSMGDDPITLYAVFKQTVTLSYSGNGSTDGSTVPQTGYRYYNNGNIIDPVFTLRDNGFSRTSYNFSKWALGSAGGTQYAVGASITLSANSTMYAVWTYVGAPFYIVEGVTQEETGLPGGVVRSSLSWTIDGAGNGGSISDVSAGRWNVDGIYPVLEINPGGDFRAHTSVPIATNGNHMLYIRFSGTEQDGTPPKVGISPNAYADSIDVGLGMRASTFDVTGLSNVTIYVYVPGFRWTDTNTGEPGGHYYIEFVDIKFY